MIPIMISKLHAAAIHARARALIARLEEEQLVRRQTKHQAVKALMAIDKMFTFAEPALAKMTTSERQAWTTRRALIDDWLKLISRRGI